MDYLNAEASKRFDYASLALDGKSKLARQKGIHLFFPFFLLFTFLLTFSYSNLQAKTLTNFDAQRINYSEETVSNYSKFNIQGTSFLSFRDIPELVQKFVNGKKTLDYGCGAGRSTRFLRSMGLEVTGVDICQKFLQEAHSMDLENEYFLIQDSKIPAPDNTYDFIFSSHVLLMIPTKDKLSSLFKEIYRTLKPGGIFIAVTSSEEMHSPQRNWISYVTDFPENSSYGSGSLVKLLIKDVNAVFIDYNWTEDDYLELLSSNNFEILKTHFPLGNETDGYPWISEKDCSPYAIYVVKKPEYNSSR